MRLSILVALFASAALMGRLQAQESEPASGPVLQRVRVLDSSGEPLGGVGVAVASFDHGAYAAEALSRSLNDEARFLDLFRSKTTNEKGEIEIVNDKDVVVIRGQIRDLFGMLTVSKEDPGVSDLVLTKDSTVAIDVAHADGKPVVNAEIGFYPRPKERGDAWHSSRTVKTDQNGRATLRHARTTFDRSLNVLRYGKLTPEDAMEVAARGAFPTKATKLQVGLATDAHEKLILPECGSVEVAVHDETGAACDDPLFIGIQFERYDPEVRGTLKEGFDLETVTWDGRATFLVRAGEKMLVEVRDRSRRYVPQTRKLPGPQTPGSQVKVEFQLKDRVPVIAGRLLKDGQPFRNQAVRAVIGCRGPVAEQEVEAGQFETGQGGEFEVLMNVLPLLQASRLEPLWIEFQAGDGPDPEFIARIEPKDFPRDGHVDFGAVPIRAAPILVSGTVRGPDGAPVAGAHVGAVELGDGPEGGWTVRVGRLSGVSDASGRFRINGRTSAKQIAVCPAHDSLLSPGGKRVPAGTADVELRLHRASKLTMRILLDKGVPPDVVWVAVTGDPVRGPEWRGRGGLAGLMPGVDASLRTSRTPSGRMLVPVGDDGELTLDELVPGTATVELRVAGASVPVARFENVIVEEGAMVADTRLKEVDLRGKVTVSTFKITRSNASADARRWGSVRLVPVGSMSRSEELIPGFFDGTTLRFGATPERGPSLVLHEDGSSTELPGGIAEGTAEWREPLAVRVQLPGAVLDATKGLALEAELDFVEYAGNPNRYHIHSGANLIRLRGDLRQGQQTSLPGPGTYCARWRVWLSGFPSQPVRGSQNFKVSKTDAVIEIPVPVAEAQRAAQLLGGAETRGQQR